MGLKVEDIRQIQNPYKVLGNGDALAENREGLNELTSDEKKNLSTRLVLECPDTELNDFGHAIEAARVPQDDEDSFHSVLANAFEVKKRMASLLDARNIHPHLFMLGKEVNIDLYNDFSELALTVIKGNEVATAQRLALTTPEESRSEVSVNIRNMFPNSAFSSKLNAAFALRREVDRLLKGDQPEAFFSSREFNIDTCLEFSGLFPSLLKGHEQAIGEKLSTLDSTKVSEIGRLLEQLNNAAHDQNNPFRLIAAAMTPKQQQQRVPLLLSDDNESDDEVEITTPAAHPNSLFGGPRKPASTPVAMEEVASSPAKKDDKQEKGCCGLW